MPRRMRTPWRVGVPEIVGDRRIMAALPRADRTVAAAGLGKEVNSGATVAESPCSKFLQEKAIVTPTCPSRCRTVVDRQGSCGALSGSPRSTVAAGATLRGERLLQGPRQPVVPSRNTVVERNSSPGRSTVLGKSGWCGESGKCWVSSATPENGPYGTPLAPLTAPRKPFAV